MCFSAPASFIASGGLIALGGASFTIAKKEDKILAAIPFLFGIQQGIEGFQWLYLNSGTSSLPLGYSFLFFALMVWPIYVPTSVFILDKKRRSTLKWFIFLGIAVALYFSELLLTRPLVIHKLKACVNYGFYNPYQYIVMAIYLLAIFGPLFVSDYKIFKWFGIIAAFLAIITELFFTMNFTSVWCFFAAIVSSMFFVYIKHNKSDQKN